LQGAHDIPTPQIKDRTVTLPQTYIGVDVAKDWIDVFDPTASRHERIPTDVRSLRRFAATVGSSIVILEASGGYERPVMIALSKAGRHVTCVTPRQAREFARATGRLAKSDRVDAQVLAEMGRALQLIPARPRSAERQRLSDLTAHRDDITAMIVAEKNRLRTTQDQWIRRNILQHIRSLQASQAKAEAEMEAVIQEQDDLRDQAARLRCIKGIGPVVSATLIAQLPELGQLDRRRIAALAGLAPHANDSGHRRGKRSIWGGRDVIRRSLYLAALTASRFDPRFRAFKERLLAAGKPRKLVIVACARKLLTVLNAMMRTGTPYREAVD
jgi:transposase